jgi:hypothetical protein
LLICLCLLASACGAPAALSATNPAPTAPVSQAGIYSYALSVHNVPPSPAGCNPQISGLCQSPGTDCSGWSFRLASDTGFTDYLNRSGRLYLSTGNWTGATGGPSGADFLPSECTWSLTLQLTG